MPTYPYHCIKCGHDHDVIKSILDSKRLEQCPLCAIDMNRVYTAPYLIGTSVQHAEYNPALGCVTKNRKHRDEIARQKGLVEVGNDYGSSEKMQKKFEKDREEKFEQSWEDRNVFKDD